VEGGTSAENPPTVATMDVFRFAIMKSTTPAEGVPIKAAWFMSFTPTAAVPPSNRQPMSAAMTIQSKEK
jgi:hypothetical protein